MPLTTNTTSLDRLGEQHTEPASPRWAEKDKALPVGHGFDAPGYHALERVLRAAYDQSAYGKGKERHANEKAFDRQPIMEIGRMVGPGFATGQVMKKVQEASGMIQRAELDRAQAELLGAIVYAAAAWLLIEERR